MSKKRKKEKRRERERERERDKHKRALKNQFISFLIWETSSVADRLKLYKIIIMIIKKIKIKIKR